jgi:hypothetical protein
VVAVLLYDPVMRFAFHLAESVIHNQPDRRHLPTRSLRQASAWQRVR